ncbi:MAG: hypothetical protein JRI66_12900 [Deltaproteobacteria bacterium]|nr:hypothetical protein [Deltaproteobacteria bacterium]
MAKDPIKNLDQLIKKLAPTVMKVVEKHSLRMQAHAVSRHLTGGTGTDRLARRTGTLARSTRALKARLQGSKVTGGIAFGTKYAKVHIGPSSTKFTIRPKTRKFLAIPLPAAKTAAGVPRGRPLDGIWGPTFIAKGVIFGYSGGTKGTQSAKPIPLFALKRSVVIPRRVDPNKHLLAWVRPQFMADLKKAVQGA